MTDRRCVTDGAAVLITGGAGFIGSHLVEHLMNRGILVTVVDNLATGSLDNLSHVLPRIRFIEGDIGDILRRKALTVSDYSFVFHLAANPYIPSSVENPAFDLYENLSNTFTLLEALRHSESPPRLINTSSAAVYGNPVRLPMRESDPTVPIAPYGVSKLSAEHYVSVYSRLYGIKATSLRLFSVFGPRQRKHIVFDLFQKIRATPDRIRVLGDGTQARDFGYVQDVVEAMTLVADAAPGEGEAYNVASGTTTTIAELVAACCAVWGATPTIEYTGSVRPGDAEKWDVDLTQIAQLGYKPRVSLVSGLKAIREWYLTIE